MKKFNNIHNKSKFQISKENWITAINDLKEAIINPNHKMYNIIGKGQNVSSNALDYYTNAIRMANNEGFFDTNLKNTINRINKQFSILGEESKTDLDIITINIDIILESLGDVNGMGEVILPELGKENGSGDVPGATGLENIIETEIINKVSMKKFEDIKTNRDLNENEIYFPITDIGDPATLILLISKELKKRNSANLSDIVAELTKIEISYNGTVDISSLKGLSDILDIDIKKLKNKVDKLMDKNIELLENMQVQFIKNILENPKEINEGILGRTIGGLAGLTFGPKIGKIIAKVLGIEKGPLFNILTSRVVSAALAQELTKNLL